MQLSADVFEQIVTSLQENDSSGSEKRRKPRMGLRAARVTILLLNHGIPQSPITVHVRDISSGGICIADHEAMRRGKQFIVRLPRRDEEPLLLVCTVRHCRMITEDSFSIGAEFDTLCTKAQAESGAVQSAAAGGNASGNGHHHSN